MKQNIKRTVAFMLALAFALTGMQLMEAQAAAKPVISSSQITIKGSSCTVAKGGKMKLIAKSGKTDITKKCAWKSSEKAVATVSSKGVLTAKKAGTTNVTVKYKGKTSKKLKVIVIGQPAASAEPLGPSDPVDEPDPEPDQEPDQPATPGSHTITYNVNSKDKSDKLKGKSKQYVSGEILKFDTTVTPASGKKFLGWYDAPTGGNHIYETYKPTDDMTLYAHYTDKNIQKVTFSLGCSYADGENVTFMGKNFGWANGSYEYPSMTRDRGPMMSGDSKNLLWPHNYAVNDKTTFTVDNLPKPELPGYTFVGWYTSDQNDYDKMDQGTKVENGQAISTDVTMLYARFSKKLTISFDDLHGGKYDDIVIDTYTSPEDAGYSFPVPDIPGITFKGWQISSHPSDPYAGYINNTYVFNNLIFNYGYECHYSDTLNSEICMEAFRDARMFYYHTGTVHNSITSAHAEVEVYEETDHIVLYPMYDDKTVIYEFDPNGGTFNTSGGISNPNYGLTIYTENDGNFKKGFGYRTDLVSDSFYGTYTSYIPGHEGDDIWKINASGKKIPRVTRSNYVFAGWVLPDGSMLAEDTVVTGNITLTAKWTSGTCMVLYDANGGKITQEERDRVGLLPGPYYNVTAESTIAKDGKQMPVPVSSQGRKFAGWFTEDGEPVTENTQILSDMALFARWE